MMMKKLLARFFSRIGWVPRPVHEAVARELAAAISVNAELRGLLRDKDERIEQHLASHERVKSEHQNLAAHHEKTKAGVAILSEALKRMKNTQTINMAELNGRFR